MNTSTKSETDDTEEVEEELLVYADFDTVIDEAKFQQDSLFKVIGLESDEPFLQIGTQMYSGKWYDSVGTHLFFEPEPAPLPSDPVFSDVPANLLNYKFKTRKCLELSRVFINPKQKEDNVDNVDLQQSDNVTENKTTHNDNTTENQAEDAMDIVEVN